jgi:hypothetical protein
MAIIVSKISVSFTAIPNSTKYNYIFVSKHNFYGLYLATTKESKITNYN